jgi:hypothetical protein
MEIEVKNNLQQKINEINIPVIKSLHNFPGVPSGFKPWEVGLSPSALYSCSLTYRKKMKIKTPEVKWISIKRWVTVTPSGIQLPSGVFFSIKRKEDYVPFPKPHFVEKDYVLMMFPYGNVWSQKAPNEPITEEWLFEEVEGTTILEVLMKKDAAHPVVGYMPAIHKIFKQEEEKQLAGKPSILWIHTKRRDKLNSTNT